MKKEFKHKEIRKTVLEGALKNFDKIVEEWTAKEPSKELTYMGSYSNEYGEMFCVFAYFIGKPYQVIKIAGHENDWELMDFKKIHTGKSEYDTYFSKYILVKDPMSLTKTEAEGILKVIKY